MTHTMRKQKSFNRGKQQGYVLATGLVILLILTLVAITTMQSSSLEYSISSNQVFSDHAFQASESARLSMAGILDEHVYERGWPSTIVLPAGLNILDKDSDGTGDYFYVDNTESANTLLNGGALTRDATYIRGGTGGDIKANLYVYKTLVVLAPGASSTMSAGYEGLGKAAAAGGTHMYFEIRGEGQAPADAHATTASDFRTVVRN